MKKLLYLAVPAILATGCGDQNNVPQSTTPSLSPLLVSSGFTLNDKPAVSFYFGSSDEDVFDVTIYQENIQSGYSVENYKSNAPEVSVNAIFDGTNYSLSNKHDTNFKFSIAKAGSPSDPIQVVASGILVNAASGKFLELPPINITYPSVMVSKGLNQ